MTDYWQTKGTDGISPNVDKNIVPNDQQGSNKDVGASDDRWENAFVENVNASANALFNAAGGDRAVFQVNGEDQSVDAVILIGAASLAHRIWLGAAAMNSTDSDPRTILCQENDELVIPVASFKQRAESAPFVDYEGTTSSDTSKNISTGNGNGGVVGPEAKGTADFGWAWNCMVRKRVTPPAPAEPFYIWMPGYIPDE